jgi:hypothetical protein
MSFRLFSQNFNTQNMKVENLKALYPIVAIFGKKKFNSYSGEYFPIKQRILDRILFLRNIVRILAKIFQKKITGIIMCECTVDFSN